MNYYFIKVIYIKLYIYNEMIVFSNFNVFFLEIRIILNFVKFVSF